MVNGFLYSKNYNYMALYSSKCGCSSIRYLFLELHKNELNNKQEIYDRHTIKTLFEPPKSIDTSKIKKYVVIRNPYLRVVSMFTSKYIGENNLLKRKFRKNNINCEGNSFLFFLLALKYIKDKGILNNVDCHIAEQTNKLEFPLSNNIEVIKLENFDTGITNFYFKNFKNTELFSKYKNIHDSPNNFLHSNKTSTNNSYGITDTSKIEFTNTLNIPTYINFYVDPVIKQLVDYIYHDDFVKLGYKKELPF
jgi:hypothetical protein